MNYIFLCFGILVFVIGLILGVIFLIVLMVVLIEIRFGVLMCGNLWVVKIIVFFVIFGVFGCVIFIVVVFYELVIY